ncbi:pro-opiomelanocortin-like [Trachinotus anak]|uniref:pro-opiomelanocortin-like n=1 Tax=Trachinotus anak TaxID=443729 RepID=UPI0039F18F3F
MCPVWLLVALTVVGVARGAVNQCLEHPSCQEVNNESSMMECIQLCRSDLSAQMPVPPGDDDLQPPSLSDPESLPSLSLLPPSPPSSPQAKRSYSMEHFRWGKPVGRKRRPIKLYTSNGVEEESAEVFPGEVRRREAESEEQGQLHDVQEKKDSTYKMKHFRWSGPPASKRYSMRSRDEGGQKPLLTLFKTINGKDGHEQKTEQ